MGAIGAVGPTAGLVQEGGKVAKDVVNVGSSFLVGNVTSGTQDLAYGAQAAAGAKRSQRRATQITNNNISGNYELTRAMGLMELKPKSSRSPSQATAAP